MSKNNALELAILNHVLGKAALPETTHMRLRAILSYTDLEAGAGLTYSSAGPVAVTPADITISSVDDPAIGGADTNLSQFAVAVKETAAISAGETPKRFVLELSNDGGSTWPYSYYSDAADGTTLVASGGIFRITFSGSEN